MKKKKQENNSNPKKSGPKQTNPFEIKVHKVKHNVLGKKTAKDVVGNPNQKKQKGLDSRKASLLREYKNKNKSNSLRDKRLGENDASISLEEKMLKRFAKERLKSDKKTKFNLNDDDDDVDDDIRLTHMGQSVADMQDMKGGAIDSDFEDDDDDNLGRLGSEHVEKLHFGGGEENDGDQSGKRKQSDIIEEIIAKSKQAKYQRKVEKDEAEEMTGKLDEEWKSLAGLLGGIRPVRKDETQKSEEKGKADDYDVMVRELMFEKKGLATDRLKTEEEIAKAEMEQLEALEQERLRRMRGLDEVSSFSASSNHRSADDLDDGFLLDEEDRKRKKVAFTLAYKDGKAITEGEEEEEEMSGVEQRENGDEMDVEDEGVEDDSDEDDEDREGYSDVEDDDDSGEEESGEEENEEEEEMNSSKKTSEGAKKKGILKVNGINSTVENAEKAAREIPYTFVMPTSLDELHAILKPFNVKEQLLVIERVKKCHHPSLAEGNKDKLIAFYDLLLQLFLDSCSASFEIELLDGLTRHLHEMLKLDHAATGKPIHRHLAELRLQHDWRSAAPLRTCLFLKLISRLFPTSDFSHPVVSPAFLFLGELLQRTSINSMSTVMSGLFLSSLSYDYVRLAKRFMPEPLNFLNGVLFLARGGGDSDVDFGKVIPPCRPVGKHNRLLMLDDGDGEMRKITQSNSKDDSFKISLAHIPVDAKKKSNSILFPLTSTPAKVAAVRKAIRLLIRFRKLYAEIPAVISSFSLSNYFLTKLPDALKNDSEVKSLIRASGGGGGGGGEAAASGDETVIIKKAQRLTRLSRPKARPQPLPQFEPKFDMDFDGRKRFAGDQERKDKLRMQRQYKMEFKAAAKDLRQDAAFLANVKIAEQVAKDKKRNAKVKEIYGHLSTQEGEHKQFERMKKRK